MIPENIVIERFSDLTLLHTSGIGIWLSDEGSDERVIERVQMIDERPLTKVQFNQLLVLAQEGSVSDGFFRYYWCTPPDTHPYDVRKIDAYKPEWTAHMEPEIRSLDQLHWGLYRLFVDAMLYFGNIRACFRSLRSKHYHQIQEFFSAKRFDTDKIASRGPALGLRNIDKDRRYLISEMACKSYGKVPKTHSELREVLLQAWAHHVRAGGKRASIRSLLAGTYVTQQHSEKSERLLFSADDIMDADVGSPEDILERYDVIATNFEAARQAALHNTELYLSMVNDLDVYVATSMRTREDFRKMAAACDKIFNSDRLHGLNLRYFDPTMSAADGHEDKGLIECLMVKCARVLVYCAGTKESYGKDAEAAMALSLGKPVIFFCDAGLRQNFYREVHPLSRLIDFRSGVAVGALVTDSEDEVAELLRTSNKMNKP